MCQLDRFNHSGFERLREIDIHHFGSEERPNLSNRNWKAGGMVALQDLYRLSQFSLPCVSVVGVECWPMISWKLSRPGSQQLCRPPPPSDAAWRYKQQILLENWASPPTPPWHEGLGVPSTACPHSPPH